MRRLEAEIEKHLPDLWRYAFSLTRDRDRADDLVQDCVERALRKRLLWMPGKAAKPWLMTILLNLHRNAQRSAARRPTAPLEDEPAVPSGIEDRLDLNALLGRIDGLPDEMKSPLLLVVVGGLSYAEVSAALDIPTGTVMSRISRARARLKAETGREPTVLRSVR